ncbi:MAG: hypothetical protein J3R72DRAFT_448271 [Linnemannia gamsii]|nr:MAG: hypothetical protein J3R72DRAFT_448271 [Linnemannia gamsii]
MSLMTPACIRFINIPELVACLTPFLEKRDISHLSKVSRTFHAACNHHVWEILNLGNVCLAGRICRSPEALQAFIRHASVIRSVDWDPHFSWHYLPALWTYLRTMPAPERKKISIAALSHMTWGKMRFYSKPVLVPLPPLLALSRLKARVHCNSPTTLPVEMPDYDRDSHLHQTLWLVRLNCKTMTHLDIGELDYKSTRVIRDLCRTVSQLKRLKTLRLGARRRGSIHRQSLESLFFCCPESLVEFNVTSSYADHTASFNMNPLKRDWDFRQGPLVLRETPLLHLKRLVMTSVVGKDLARVFRSFLEHAPALEALHFSDLGVISDDMELVLVSIGKVCPRISDLETEKCSGKLLRTILEALPVQHLKCLKCLKQINSGEDPQTMIDTWIRHSTTLRQIELCDSTQVDSTVIQAALKTLRALEVLRVTARSSLMKVCLKLEHAVESGWVCTGLRHLEILISTTPAGDSPAYLKDHSKASWTEENHRHWENLGKFYSQIASLARLEVLNLRSVGLAGLNHQNDVPVEKTCLPGLMFLADPSTGRLGYLSTLEPLKRLRELRGSFRWIHEAVQERVGEREVDWFVNHLPKLELVAFGGGSYEFVQMLHKRRPGLKGDGYCSW